MCFHGNRKRTADEMRLQSISHVVMDVTYNSLPPLIPSHTFKPHIPHTLPLRSHSQFPTQGNGVSPPSPINSVSKNMEEARQWRPLPQGWDEPINMTMAEESQLHVSSGYYCPSNNSLPEGVWVRVTGTGRPSWLSLHSITTCHTGSVLVALFIW